MWTKLLYISIPQAIKPQFVNGKWHRSLLSGRYKNLLKRTFKMHGLPWIYDTEAKRNPRHKMPKGHSYVHEKPIRLAKIKKALENNAELELKLRQEKLNNKRLSGLDKVIKHALPSFMSSKREANIEANDGETEMVNSLGLSRKGPKYTERKKEEEKAKSL